MWPPVHHRYRQDLPAIYSEIEALDHMPCRQNAVQFVAANKRPGARELSVQPQRRRMMHQHLVYLLYLLWLEIVATGVLQMTLLLTLVFRGLQFSPSHSRMPVEIQRNQHRNGEDVRVAQPLEIVAEQ